MHTTTWKRLTIAGLGMALAGVASAGMAEPNQPQPPADPNPAAKPPMVDPAAIWPVGLARLAGKYRYIQVCSPGGLWESAYPKVGGGAKSRQVSINEIPAELREKLTHAEIDITDVKPPASIEASEQTSPSGRGKLRFYDETAEGQLLIRNIPGASGEYSDRGEFSGHVTFSLSHRSHSNPSPSGIFLNRQQQEPTWGTATIDYGDLSATADALPAKPENGDKPVPAEKPTAPAKKGGTADKAGASSKPAAGGDPEAEGRAVMENVRALRSGQELVAYVEWRTKKANVDYTYRGTIRLIRIDPAAEQGANRPRFSPSVGVPIRPSASPQP